MMGICAGSAAEGVQTLKAWVGGMGLPRGRLHGMDKDGVAVLVRHVLVRKSLRINNGLLCITSRLGKQGFPFKIICTCTIALH